MSDTPTYGDKMSPFTKSLMKALGGDPKSLMLTDAQIKKWGYDRPDSVLHLIPDPEFVDLIIRISPDLLSLTETALTAQCPDGKPERLDRRVRLAFWDAYEEAAKNHQPINLEEIVKTSGGRSWESYKQESLRDPYVLAWMMRPPATYTLKMKEAHELGLDRLMDIMQLPLVDPKSGRVNSMVGMLIIQAYKLVDQRLHGAVTQKTISMQMQGGEVPKDAQAMDIASVEKRIKELEQLMDGKSLPPLADRDPAQRAETFHVEHLATQAKDVKLLPKE